MKGILLIRILASPYAVKWVCSEATKPGLKKRNSKKIGTAAGDICPAIENVRQNGNFTKEKLVLSKGRDRESLLPHQGAIS